jgi:hypothetical protein
MTERLFRRGHQPQDLVFRERTIPHDAGHARRPDRERAGLVEDHRVDAREVFQDPGPLDEDVVPVGPVGRADDGGGDADARGHAVVGHQNCGAGVEAARDRGAERGQAQGPTHIAIGQPLGEGLDVGFLVGGALDGAHDATDRGIEPDAIHAHRDLAVLDDGGGEDRIARSPLHGQRLASHGLLIDECLATHDGAIHGQTLAAADDDDVAHPQRGHAHRSRLTVLDARDDRVRRRDDLVQRATRGDHGPGHDVLPSGAQPGEQCGGRVVPARREQEQRRGLQHVTIEAAMSQRRGRPQQGRRLGGDDETGHERRWRRHQC